MTRATIIEYLEQPSYDTSARAYIHFDYQNRTSQIGANIFTSLLRQLLRCFGTQSWPPNILEPLQRSCSGGIAVDIRDIITLIFQCCNHFPKVFLIFDALDECEDQAVRWKVMNFIDSAIRSQPNIRTLITSRPQISLDDSLNQATVVHITSHLSDIEKYIRENLQYTGKKFSIASKEEIVSKLLEKADGK
jgi:ankyrin repeat domain-containing protein 50